MKKAQHIVIIGAGFAGLMAAVRLSRKSDQYPMQITLINASEDYIIRPRLHEWATNQTQDRQKIGDMLSGTGVEFIKAWVTNLHPKQNSMTIQTESGTATISYDSLIVALGSHPNTKAIDGIADYAYIFDAHAERGAEALRQKLLAYQHSNANVVVIGGGATGIEGATHIKSLNPHLDVTIVTREALGSFKQDARVQREIQASFSEQNILVHDNSSVTRIEKEAVILGDGTQLPYDVCVWAGGFIAPTLGRDAGLEVNAQNQILIDPYQRALGYSNIIAVGDCAMPVEVPGQPYRMCCPVAMTMGAHAADNIIRSLAGKTEKPLSFDYYGQGIQLGINDAIGWLAYPDDQVHLAVTRGKPAMMIRNAILDSLDVIFDYEKRYGFYSWLGKNRYQKQQEKMAQSSKALSKQSV